MTWEIFLGTAKVTTCKAFRIQYVVIKRCLEQYGKYFRVSHILQNISRAFRRVFRRVKQ